MCPATWHICRIVLEKIRIKFYGRLLYFVIWFKLTPFGEGEGGGGGGGGEENDLRWIRQPNIEYRSLRAREIRFLAWMCEMCRFIGVCSSIWHFDGCAVGTNHQDLLCDDRDRFSIDYETSPNHRSLYPFRSAVELHRGHRDKTYSYIYYIIYIEKRTPGHWNVSMETISSLSGHSAILTMSQQVGN